MKTAVAAKDAFVVGLDAATGAVRFVDHFGADVSGADADARAAFAADGSLFVAGTIRGDTTFDDGTSDGLFKSVPSGQLLYLLQLAP